MSTAPQVLIASRLIDARDQRDACKVVRTPLELVHALETLNTVEMVILAAGFADRDTTAFLRAEYPALRIVTVRQHEPRVIEHAESFALSA